MQSRALKSLATVIVAFLAGFAAAISTDAWDYLSRYWQEELKLVGPHSLKIEKWESTEVYRFSSMLYNDSNRALSLDSASVRCVLVDDSYLQLTQKQSQISLRKHNSDPQPKTATKSLIVPGHYYDLHIWLIESLNIFRREDKLTSRKSASKYINKFKKGQSGEVFIEFDGLRKRFILNLNHIIIKSDNNQFYYSKGVWY